MMNISPDNPVIKKAVLNAFQEESDSIFTGYEYENGKFAIQKLLDQNILQFSFSCHNFNEIYNSGKQYFLKKYYSNFTVESTPVSGFDLTLSLDLSEYKEIKRIPKKISAEEEEKLKAENKAQKKKNKKFSEESAQSLSRFKRNFYGSPIEYILSLINDGSQIPQEDLKITYATRKSERTWIICDNNEQVTFYFGLNFDDKADKTIAQMVLDEMKDSIRLLKNPISIKQGKYPDTIQKIFPESTKQNLFLSNGLISITLFKKSHIQNAVEQATTLLQGIRQYIHYHVHASKSYLHSRLLSRIQFFQKELSSTKFEKDEDKYYRTLKQDNLIVKGDHEEDTLKDQIIRKN